MMNQRFDEDRAELEAHFAERVQAYIELGETPEQAKISALQKFGETEMVRRKLRSQRILHSPLLWAIGCAATTVAIAYVSKHFLPQSAWTDSMFFTGIALYFLRAPRAKRC